MPRTFTPEHIAALKAAQVGHPRTPAQLANLARMHEARRGKPGRRLSAIEIENLRIVNTGRKASDETRAKQRAAKLGKPGPWLGKKRGPRSPETIKKQRASVTGKPKTLTPEERERRRTAKLGMKHSDDIRARIRAALARPDVLEKIRQGPLGKPCRLKPTRHLYNGRWFRSGYEARVARELDRLNITWHYEPTRFDFGSFTYAPDFYLPDAGAYWEVKGYYRDKCREKVERFRATHPDTPLVLITKRAVEILERSGRGV